jgi:uncharacterized protein YoaH (UPF0181 family)
LQVWLIWSVAKEAEVSSKQKNMVFIASPVVRIENSTGVNHEGESRALIAEALRNSRGARRKPNARGDQSFDPTVTQGVNHEGHEGESRALIAEALRNSRSAQRKPYEGLPDF